MDPTVVYTRYRDDALAQLFSAERYSTFVAMPFRDRFSYRATDIYRDVIQAAAARANLMVESRNVNLIHRFDVPRRIDDQPQTARSIGDEIIRTVLYSHLVIADLTFANDGVMIELGASLAFKPTQHLILITQGSASELHFDIRGNVIIEYSRPNGIDEIAKAMVAGAMDFESRRDSYLTHLTRDLSRDAIWLLNWYGRLRNGWFRDTEGNRLIASLHEGLGIQAFLGGMGVKGEPEDWQRTEATMRFQLALRELLARRLVWTDYRPRTPEPGLETHSYRGTRLGWMFISQLWPALTCPEDETLESNAL